MRFPAPRSVARLTASVALAGTLALAGGAALAQDATPANEPLDPATCVSPGLDPASPAAASSMATPAAVQYEELDALIETATPVEDEAVIADATAAVENLYACYNADGASFLGLFTDEAFATYWGGIDPEVLAELNPVVDGQLVSNVEIHEVLELDDGRFAIDYQVTVGYQVEHQVDVFVEEDGVWLVDANTGGDTPETSLDATTASVKVSETDDGHAIEVSPNPIMNQPAVKLQIANQTDDFLIVVLLRGGDAASMPADLDPAGLPEDVVILGTVAVEPGEHAIGLWEGLEEGDYVIFVETGHGTAAYDLTIDPPFDPEA